MSFDIPLLNSCWCFSLRTSAIIIGSWQLFISILYFVDILMYRIRISIDNPNERYLFLIFDVVFEYAQTLQIVFSGFLVYGALKRKSSFVIAWLLNELATIIDLIWNSILLFIWFFHLDYLIDEFILLGVSMVVVWVVYRYYISMPKSKYIL